MRILIISTSPFFIVRGTPLRTRIFVEGYLENGSIIDLLTYPVGEDLYGDRINIVRPKASFYRRTAAGPSMGKAVVDLFLLAEAIRLCRSTRYDVVHCEDSEAALIGTVLKKLFRKKIVASFHNRLRDNLALHGWRHLGLPARALEKSLYRNADYIITNNDWFSSFLRNEHGVEKVAAVYDYVTAREVHPGFDPPGRYLVYAGNSAPYQGLDLLLKSFRGLSEKYPELRLYLVGEMSAHVSRLSDTLRLGDRVVMTGELSLEKTNFLVRRSLFSVNPCLIREPVPNMKTLQYLSAGAPIVATDVASNRLFLEHRRNAFLVEPEPAALTGGMVELIENEALRQKLRVGISQTVTAQNVAGILSHAVKTVLSPESEVQGARFR